MALPSGKWCHRADHSPDTKERTMRGEYVDVLYIRIVNGHVFVLVCYFALFARV